MKLTFKPTPYSSIVGSGITVLDETGRAVAQLAILVPSPQDDYKTVAQQVIVAVCKPTTPSSTTQTATDARKEIDDA